MNPLPMPRLTVADLDWASLRFPGEAALRAELGARPELKVALAAWSDPARLPAHYPAEFCAGGLVASARVMPAFFRVATTIRRTLRLPSELELHVFAWPHWLIDLLPVEEPAPIRVALSTPAAQGLWVREALFAVGRKLGPILQGEVPLRADPSAGQPALQRSLRVARGLWRFQELSSDRIGLLCCQDLAAAVRAIAKSATGLTSEALHIDPDRLLDEPIDEEEAMLAPLEHPFLRFRLAALARFARSDAYAQALVGKAPLAPRPEATEPALVSAPVLAPAPAVEVSLATPPAESVEALPADELGLEQWPTPDEVRRAFALHAAFWLLSERDGVGDRERAALEDVFGPTFLDEIRPRYERAGEPVFEATARALAPRITDLDSDLRHWILRDLIHIAIRDGALEPADRRVIEQVAALVDIAPGPLSALLAEYVEPEFADYHFLPGQEVEVMLDGEWVEGIVQTTEPSGDVRVRLGADPGTLLLSPRADLLRPLDARKKAG